MIFPLLLSSISLNLLAMRASQLDAMISGYYIAWTDCTPQQLSVLLIDKDRQEGYHFTVGSHVSVTAGLQKLNQVDSYLVLY